MSLTWGPDEPDEPRLPIWTQLWQRLRDYLARLADEIDAATDVFGNDDLELEIDKAWLAQLRERRPS